MPCAEASPAGAVTISDKAKTADLKDISGTTLK
jgi:hypothetical protein